MSTNEHHWINLFFGQLNAALSSCKPSEELSEEASNAIKEAGAAATGMVWMHASEVLQEYPELLNSKGEKDQSMSCIPAAQYLMVTIGTAGALLDALLAYTEQKTETSKEAGNHFDAEAMTLACREIIKGVRQRAKHGIAQGLEAWAST